MNTQENLYAFLTPDGMWVSTTDNSGGFWMYTSVPTDKVSADRLFLLTEKEMKQFISLSSKIYCPSEDESYHYRKRDLNPVPVTVQISTDQISTRWVYVQSEPQLWTVGFYDPTGKWHIDSDGTKEECAERCAWLNGEQPFGSFVWVSTKKEQPMVDGNYLSCIGDDPRNGEGIFIVASWNNRKWLKNISPDFWLKMIR